MGVCNSFGRWLVLIVLRFGGVLLGGSPRPGIVDIALLPLLIGLPNLPFLILFFHARRRVREGWPPLPQVRGATIASTICMAMPNFLLVVMAPLEFRMDAPDAGTGSGFFIVFELVLVPILGIIGWRSGRKNAGSPRPSV